MTLLCRHNRPFEHQCPDCVNEAFARERFRHVKTGGLYTEIGRGQVQTETPLNDGAHAVAYLGADGRLWFRPVDEFDAKFERQK